MADIVIYTKPETLLHKQDKLPNDDDTSDFGVYYWELSHLPKDIKNGDRVYFATKKFIRGFFIVTHIVHIIKRIEWQSDSWRDIKPIPCKQFQGFKYFKTPNETAN